jgi:hypothetical protein
VIIVLLVSALIMASYWIVWSSARGAVASNTRPAYYEFENAFPLADGWITFCLLAAAWSLWRDRASALLWLLAGGGAGIYLFGMDVLYDVEHGIWWRSGAGGVIELAINIVTLIVSVGLLRWAWLRRTRLIAG